VTDVIYADLIQSTRLRWHQLHKEQQEPVLVLPFVSHIEGSRIFFQSGYRERDVTRPLERTLTRLVGSAHLKFHYAKEPVDDRFVKRVLDPAVFASLTFGSDVAEQDAALHHYFISTKAFQLVQAGQKSIVIGPKGSGKSAILAELTNAATAGYSVVITPEVFATSMLRKFVEDSDGAWDEDEAFISTWIFTIFVEVFKQICERSRGIPEKALRRIREFLRDNASYQQMDLFTRFIGYLKRIQSIKLGEYELTVKTRLLQDLYSLAPVYELIPDLRTGLKADVLILIDELDQGWDNSVHSNRFIGALLQAAVRITRLGLRVRVVVFIRSEIFDLVKYDIDQLDKVRSSIEMLRWTPGELGGLVLKRIEYCARTDIAEIEKELSLLAHIFVGSCRGVPGFQYLISRTTRRPREVLQYLRLAHSIAVASGMSGITSEVLLKAEEEFSGWKLEHLCSEYKYIYPGLKDLLWAFRAFGPVFSATDALDLICSFVDGVAEPEKPPWMKATPREILQNLYSVDFLGVQRPSRGQGEFGIVAEYEFAYDRPSANVKASPSFLIHPALWAALEIPPA
jgi:hypothetical protein